MTIVRAGCVDANLGAVVATFVTLVDVGAVVSGFVNVAGNVDIDYFCAVSSVTFTVVATNAVGAVADSGTCSVKVVRDWFVLVALVNVDAVVDVGIVALVSDNALAIETIFEVDAVRVALAVVVHGGAIVKSSAAVRSYPISNVAVVAIAEFVAENVDSTCSVGVTFVFLGTRRIQNSTKNRIGDVVDEFNGDVTGAGIVFDETLAVA